MRVLLVLLVVARTAAADAPSGYQCTPGSPKIGQGCTCPTGYISRRGDENVAICAATTPPPDLKGECTKLGAAIAAGKTKVDGAFFAGAPPYAKATGFRAMFGPAFAEECTVQKWTPAQRSCFATAQDASSVWGCLEKLSVVHRDRIDAAVARSLPPWIEVTAKGMRLYGRIPFTGNALVPDSFAALNALSNQMVTDPTLRFEVQVHTSNTGTRTEQVTSTQQKADAVRRHLLDVFKHGEDRIVAKGYAADQPIADNRTAEGRAQNRRVEFRRLAPPPGSGPTPPPAPTAPPAPRSGNDRDGDRIADAGDKCPDERETYNGVDDEDGCPDRGRVVVTNTSVEILDMIYFEFNKAVIKPQSFAILDQVAATLTGNPEIELIEVQGHTDERGDDNYNLKMSEERAKAVASYLVAKGIDAKRLTARGYGETKPLDRGSNEQAWAKNRRIDFLILKRR